MKNQEDGGIPAPGPEGFKYSPISEMVTPKPDMVNHPPHYTFGGIEVLDAIEAWELNYRRGNVVKYLVRAGRKSKFTELEDLKKAQFYLAREIVKLEEERAVREKIRQELAKSIENAAKTTDPSEGTWKVVTDAEPDTLTFQYVEPKKKPKRRKKR